METTCPHCGLDAVSAWRKLALGPASTAKCRRCGLKVSAAVPQALLSFVPSVVAVAVVLSGAVRGPGALIALGAVGWTITSVLYLVWVPLVARQVTRQDAVAAARAGIERR